MYTKEDLKRDVEELKKARNELANKIDDYKKELEEFLSYDFMPRVGGGIGMTRMISALG